MATPDGGAALVRAALDTYGRVDILVSNAGILRDALLEDTTPGVLDPVLDVHVKALFHVTRPTWKVMREQGYGRVVNTTSAAGLLGSPHKSNYGTAKAGVAGFTRVLAVEGAEHGIKVNAIAPIAATRMLVKHLGEGSRLDPANTAMVNAVLGRLDPELVAPVVAFLAHEDCPVTREIYTAGAGQIARFFIGRTPGYHHPELSVEDVRDHLAEIRDETGYTVPAGPGKEIAQLLRVTQPGVVPDTLPILGAFASPDVPRAPSSPRTCCHDHRYARFPGTRMLRANGEGAPDAFPRSTASGSDMTCPSTASTNSPSPGEAMRTDIT